MICMALFVFDVGGVFRDSSKAINEGYKKGFIDAGLTYSFNPEDIWHLRGIGKYNRSSNCIKTLLAIQKTGYNLNEIIHDADAETKLDEIIKNNLGNEDEKIVDFIEKEYKNFFNSQEASNLIKLYPDARNSIELLYNRGYKLGIFTNSSILTVKRDLKELGLNKFSSIVSEESVENKKPSGEGIKKIISEINEDKRQTFYIGDSVVDIKAAKNAGCKSVALLSGMGLEIHIRKENPDFIFGNLAKMAKYFVNANMKSKIK